MSQSVRVRKRCFIKVPPALINPLAGGGGVVTKIDLINKELNLLNEIHREQIIEKQIVSWLNSEQFLRRNFNYNAYQCIICNQTKTQILESHYLNNNNNNNNSKTTNESNTAVVVVSTNRSSSNQFHYSDEMKTVVLTNHVLSHFNEYCYRCMSCKISWPDRTQLLKHAQECPNSQVVRTKTKYKLKANCRLQLKFYLQTYLDYWMHEKMLETHSLNSGGGLGGDENKLNFKIYLNDIILNKSLLMNASGRFNLNSINLDDGKQMLLKDDDDDDDDDEITSSPPPPPPPHSQTNTNTTTNSNEQILINNDKNEQDITMKDELEKGM